MDIFRRLFHKCLLNAIFVVTRTSDPHTVTSAELHLLITITEVDQCAKTLGMHIKLDEIIYSSIP